MATKYFVALSGGRLIAARDRAQADLIADTAIAAARGLEIEDVTMARDAAALLHIRPGSVIDAISQPTRGVGGDAV